MSLFTRQSGGQRVLPSQNSLGFDVAHTNQGAYGKQEMEMNWKLETETGN